MARGAPAEIDVVAVGKNAAIALLGGFGERRLAAPRLDHDVFRHAGDEDFVPADDGFAMLGDEFLHALVEVGLQILVVFKLCAFLNS